MKANKDPNENTTGNYASYASPTTNDNTLDLGGFVKIGGDLNEDSDPRRMRGGFLGTAGLRRRHLKLIDGQGWHYGVMAVMILDFFLEFLGISFSSERQFSSKRKSRKVSPQKWNGNLLRLSIALSVRRRTRYSQHPRRSSKRECPKSKVKREKQP